MFPREDGPSKSGRLQPGLSGLRRRAWSQCSWMVSFITNDTAVRACLLPGLLVIRAAQTAQDDAHDSGMGHDGGTARPTDQAIDLSEHPAFKRSGRFATRRRQKGKLLRPLAGVGCIAGLDLGPVHRFPLTEMDFS